MDAFLSNLLIEAEYVIRLLIAAVCGGIVGFEREKRQKSAGIRTHIIVAMASALMMIVSKYGFFDVIVYDGISLDASRIAAGVVTAIGFIGAGVIFIRKDNAVGLTTAAGLWATVGIGITIGAGMYILGLLATLLMLIAQLVMHSKRLKVLTVLAGTISINLTKHNLKAAEARRRLEKEGLILKNLSFKREESGDLILTASVILSKDNSLSRLISELEEASFLDSAEVYIVN